MTFKFKIGDRIRLVKDGYSSLFGRGGFTSKGIIVTVAGMSGTGSDKLYAIKESYMRDKPNWLRIEENFELATPNWKQILQGKK